MHPFFIRMFIIAAALAFLALVAYYYYFLLPKIKERKKLKPFDTVILKPDLTNSYPDIPSNNPMKVIEANQAEVLVNFFNTKFKEINNARIPAKDVVKVS